MAETVTIQTQIEPALKDAAEEVLERLGMTASEAMTLLYRELVSHDAFPFASRIPNDITVKTFTRSDHGEEIVQCRDTEDMFRKLGI